MPRAPVRLLKQNKVKLQGTESARVKGKTVTFPASGGMLDPTTAKGTVNHAGTLLFKAGKKSVPLNDLLLKTAQRHLQGKGDVFGAGDPFGSISFTAQAQ